MKLKLDLPLSGVGQFSKQFTADAVVFAKRIKQKFGTTIQAASNAYGIPIDILVGFMIIESEGVATAVSPAGAIGLMQLTPATAYDTIALQAKIGLKPEAAGIIQNVLPGFLKVNGVASPYSAWKDKIYTALKNADFNIWVGTICVGQLMASTVDSDDYVRLDRVVIKYNAGVGNYSKYVTKSASLMDASASVLAISFPFAETRGYIKKFVGVGGSIEQSAKVSMSGNDIQIPSSGSTNASGSKVNYGVTSPVSGIGALGASTKNSIWDVWGF